MAEFWEVCIECTDRMKDQAIKMFASQFHGMANDITIAQMKVIQAVIKLVDSSRKGRPCEMSPIIWGLRRALPAPQWSAGAQWDTSAPDQSK